MPNGAPALFWDIGGVLLSNGWDTASRRAATQRFDLDWPAFQERHELVSADFETGHATLDEYLDQTVFYADRPFDRAQFVDFMYGQSRPHPEVLELARELAGRGEVFMATINNESEALNRHRIETFNLHEIFSGFFSSCYLGVKKPDARIFETALRITHREPDGSIFIDDREINVERAKRAGLRVIHYESPAQLRRELAAHGVAGR